MYQKVYTAALTHRSLPQQNRGGYTDVCVQMCMWMYNDTIEIEISQSKKMLLNKEQLLLLLSLLLLTFK